MLGSHSMSIRYIEISCSTTSMYFHSTLYRCFSTVEAICTNSLERGDHEIKVYVGACILNNSFLVNDKNRVITGGFDTPSRLHVEEVRTSQSIDAGKIPASR